MTTDLGGIALLEQKAADLRARLHPETRERAISERVEALRQKFRQEYGTVPPADMVTDIATKTGQDFDHGVSSDLNSLKLTTEAVAQSLAADARKAEDLPDAVSDAQAARQTPLTLAETTSVQVLEQLTLSNLRADLAGTGFARVLSLYQDAVHTNRRTVLRCLERLQAHDWPGILRTPDELPQQTELIKLMGQTRRARVPDQLRAAQERVGRLWTTAFDVVHRTWQGRGFKAV